MKQYPVLFQSISNGETIAYRKCGLGEKNVVLIHGNMSSSVHFQTLMEQLEQEFTVYAVDMRGFGDSSYEHGFDSLYELAEDIEEFIRLLDIKKPTLLGWSTGGGVAMEIAADLGDEVNGLILLSSAGIHGYTILRKDQAGAPIVGDYLVTKEEIAADPLQVAPPKKALENKDREFFRYIWSAAIYVNKQPPAEDFEIYLDEIVKQRNLVDVDYSLVHFNVTETSNGVEAGSGRAKKISCPITIIHGEADIVVPVAEAKKTKEYFGDQAHLHILQGLSHSIVTDDLAALTELVKRHA